LANYQADSLIDLQVSIIIFGSFSAVLNPVALSMIRDYFPPNQRSQANAWFSTVIYWGGALASLSNFMTCQFGWRNTYLFSGTVGISLGIFGFFFL
jgi:MFS family permease